MSTPLLSRDQLQVVTSSLSLSLSLFLSLSLSFQAMFSLWLTYFFFLSPLFLSLSLSPLNHFIVVSFFPPCWTLVTNCIDIPLFEEAYKIKSSPPTIFIASMIKWNLAHSWHQRSITFGCEKERREIIISSHTTHTPLIIRFFI